MSSENESQYPNRVPIPERIIKDIESERAHARQHYDPNFDRMNTINDWITYINIYLARGASMRQQNEPPEQQRWRERQALVKAAGLCISALEAFDENQGFELRHYDFS